MLQYLSYQDMVHVHGRPKIRCKTLLFLLFFFNKAECNNSENLEEKYSQENLQSFTKYLRQTRVFV